MAFFEEVLPDTPGWVPIITKDPFGRLTVFKWFSWPDEKVAMGRYVEAHGAGDVYFKPMTFTQPPSLTDPRHATKANVLRCDVVYCDGDDMDPSKLAVLPTTFVRTSPGHWHGYWRFLDAENLSNNDLEDLSHGLYNAHAADGMDRGWPLAKMLRVPWSYNTKPEYGAPFRVTQYSEETVRRRGAGGVDLVEIQREGEAVTVAEFAAHYPPAEPLSQEELDSKVPQEQDPNEIYRLLALVNNSVANDLFMIRPEVGDDWSSRMYHLQCILMEAGFDARSCYLVLHEAACNKYRRDNRPDIDLWVQVQRDAARWRQYHDGEDFIMDDDADILRVLGLTPLEGVNQFGDESSPEALVDRLPSVLDADANGLYWTRVQFLHPEEQPINDTFIDAFTSWVGHKSPQAPWEFSVAGGLAMLSALLSRYAKLPLTFTDMGLNLYWLVLGRTTQSRKSTALRLARGVLNDVAEECGVDSSGYEAPEDATAEALQEWLGDLPRLSTLLSVDEVQDTFAAASRKGSYMAGFIPMLTKIYDGRVPAILRKTGGLARKGGVDHQMSFYGTGIFDLTARYLTMERIISGFVPRCLVVVDSREGFEPGANDVEWRTGERARVDQVRDMLIHHLTSVVKHWDKGFQAAVPVSGPFDDLRVPLKCEQDALERWKCFAYDVTFLAANHPLNAVALFPTCERLSFSALRVAALLAMTEMKDTIELRHVVKAIDLAGTWARCAEALVNQVDSNGFSRMVSDVEQWVASQPGHHVSYAALVTKFQNKFDGPEALTRVLMHCQKKGTLRDVLPNPERPGDREVVYTARATANA